MRCRWEWEGLEEVLCERMSFSKGKGCDQVRSRFDAIEKDSHSGMLAERRRADIGFKV